MIYNNTIHDATQPDIHLVYLIHVDNYFLKEPPDICAHNVSNHPFLDLTFIGGVATNLLFWGSRYYTN